MTNANETLYGPVADAAANKYGVPTSLFRSLISSESSFDPYAYNKSGASGIAQFMPGTASDLGIDPFNPYQSLDASAKYLSQLKSSTGNWPDAISRYKGYSDLSRGLGVAQKVIDDAANIFGNDLGSADAGIPNELKKTEDAAIAEAKQNGTDKPFWQWGMDDIKNFLSASTFGLMIGVVGVLFIVGSIWVLIQKGE